MLLPAAAREGGLDEPAPSLPAFRARDYHAEAQAAQARLLLSSVDIDAPVKPVAGLASLLKGSLRASASAEAAQPPPPTPAPPPLGAPPAVDVMTKVQDALAAWPWALGDESDEEEPRPTLLEGVVAGEERRLCAPRPSQFEPRLMPPMTPPAGFNHAHGFLTGLKQQPGTAAADAAWKEGVRARRRLYFEPDLEASLRVEPHDDASVAARDGPTRSSARFIGELLSAEARLPCRTQAPLELEEPCMPPAGLCERGSASKMAGRPPAVGGLAAVLRACAPEPRAEELSEEAALQPLCSAEQRKEEFERLLADTMAPLLVLPQRDPNWIPAALLEPAPRELHLEVPIMRKAPKRPPLLDPLVQLAQSPRTPAPEPETAPADGVTGYGRARLDALIAHRTHRLLASGHGRGVCTLPTPELRRRCVADPVLTALRNGEIGSVARTKGAGDSRTRLDVMPARPAAGLVAPPQPQLLPELRAARPALLWRLLQRYAERDADLPERDAADQLNLEYQQDYGFDEAGHGEVEPASHPALAPQHQQDQGWHDGRLDEVEPPAGHPRQRSDAHVSPSAVPPSPKSLGDHADEAPRTEAARCTASVSSSQDASTRFGDHAICLDDTLADSVDSFFAQAGADGGGGGGGASGGGGSGADGDRSDDRTRGGDAAEPAGLSEMLIKHALGSASLLALLPDCIEEEVPLLAAQLVSRLVAAAGCRTILWLLPDGLVSAGVDFWRRVAQGKHVQSCAARELTCVPALSGEAPAERRAGSQLAFEPPFEPPLRAGEVGFLSLARRA